MALEFDEPTHTYKVDGRVVPSVTQILTDAGLIDDQWFTEESRRRGETVAIATELDDRGSLDYKALSGRDRNYVLAWRQFKADFGGEITAIEMPVASPLGYAGTLDRTIIRDRQYLIEIKAGVHFAWHALQTAAYAECLRPGMYDRIGVYLKPGGKYKVREYHDDNDRHVWAGLVAVHNWKAAG